MSTRAIFTLLCTSVLCGQQVSPGLFQAALSGDVEEAKALLDAGKDPNMRDPDGATPLHYAAMKNHIDVAKVLLDHHADVNAQARISELRTTPLDYAVVYNSVPMARLLIDRGADVHWRNALGRSVLHLAAMHGRTEMAALLLRYGAEPGVRDEEGSAPIDEAAWNGNSDTVTLLLDAGVPIDGRQPRTGATPLIEGAFKGHRAVVEVLLARHADASLQDKAGFSALDNAVRQGQASVAPLLMKPGVAYAAFLETAALKGQPAMVDAVLRNGMDVNQRLASGATALHDASLKGNNAVIELLLARGADVNGRDGHGATPISNAALSGNASTLGLLLDHGADINARETESGSTALYEAASFGHQEAVAVLLLSGADPGICNRDGVSPLQAALANGFAEIAASIRAEGGAQACRH